MRKRGSETENLRLYVIISSTRHLKRRKRRLLDERRVKWIVRKMEKILTKETEESKMGVNKEAVEKKPQAATEEIEGISGFGTVRDEAVAAIRSEEMGAAFLEQIQSFSRPNWQ